MIGSEGMRMKKNFWFGPSLSAVSVMLAMPAQAQTPAAGPGPADTASAAPATTSPDDTTDRIEDIVVTAQRRSERLQNVPVAVTAATAARLEAAGINDTQDLSQVVPGLILPHVTGFTQPHIRRSEERRVGKECRSRWSPYH